MSSMSAERHFLDTNVLVYAYDAAEPTKQTIAREWLLADIPFALSAQVLGEFFVTVTRKLAEPLPVDRAREAIAALVDIPTHPITDTLVRAAIRRVERSRFSYWDSLIVETSIAAGCGVLLTEDLRGGQDIDGVQVINPFDAVRG